MQFGRRRCDHEQPAPTDAGHVEAMVTNGELAAVSALVHELRAVRRSLAELVRAVDELADTLVDEIEADVDRRLPPNVVRIASRRREP